MFKKKEKEEAKRKCTSTTSLTSKPTKGKESYGDST